MPRLPRDAAPGVFHVTSHSHWATDLFIDEVDRMLFVTELARTVGRFRWSCIAACLMTSHYHLLLDIEDESLPDGMHRLNCRYACRFNTRHRLRGHVFADRYASRRIESDGHLLNAFRYIARNPFEAGMCASPEAWPWSSYGATAGYAESFTFVDASRAAGCFGGDTETALERLRSFVHSSW